MSGFGSELASLDSEKAADAAKILSGLIRAADSVGDLLKMDYGTCEILVHDHSRQKVGGLPLGCFLLATRLTPGSTPELEDEDSSVLLLRVVAQSRLPNASESDLSRFEAGQRVATLDDVWDADGRTDQFTLHQLRYAGISCRVLGTFRMKRAGGKSYALTFGADVSNFYSGRGLKVYKPIGAALGTIVNYVREKGDDAHSSSGSRVPIGRLRYSSTERSVDAEGDNVPVSLDPTDLVARRTALFGMSRTGKSNTTKIVASSVFRIRKSDGDGRIGQLIFDVNGEYANENTQDGAEENKACLKNVGKHAIGARTDDISTYGLSPHPNDPSRKIVKINFYGKDPTDWNKEENVEANLESMLVGKMLIDSVLATETSKYITNFRNTTLERPAILDRSAIIRYQRALVVYRACLNGAGLSPPTALSSAKLKGLFGKELIEALKSAGATEQNYARAATILSQESASWDNALEAFGYLRRFIADAQKGSGYSNFNAEYARTHEGRSWDDERLTGLLALLEYPNGIRGLRPAQAEHDAMSDGDYAEKIVDDLLDGRLVIFDQSLGDPEMNKAAADRIMWSLFKRQQVAFVSPVREANGQLRPPSDVLVYVEEAHNLLPANSGSKLTDIWSRVAKEGSKYRIGLVYATQEPSSIQSNILKNTDNWFVAHLNNSDELKELKKYYDFIDFSESILKVPDAGFIRMRTLSNPYIVPVQVNKFTVV